MNYNFNLNTIALMVFAYYAYIILSSLRVTKPSFEEELEQVISKFHLKVTKSSYNGASGALCNPSY